MKQIKINMKTNVIYNMLYQIINFIVPILTFPYISRALNANEIGIYSYTLSIATYFGMFASLGIATYGQLKVARLRNEKEHLSFVFWELLVLKLCLFSITSVAYFVMIMVSGRYAKYYMVLSVYLLAQFFDISWFWQGLERFKTIVFRNISTKIVSCLLIFLCVKNENDIYIYMLVAQGTILLSNVTLWGGVGKYVSFVKIRMQDCFKHFRASLTYFVATISSIILISMDKSMIGWITHSAYENGCYEQAYKVFQICGGIICSLSLVILPRVTYLWKNEEINKKTIENIYFKSLRVTMCIGVPMALGCWAVSENFVPVFFGKGYEGAVPILKVLSIVTLVSGMANVIGHQGLMARGKQKEYNVILFSACLVNVIFNIFLISKWEGIGAAYATLISNGILLCGFSYLSNDIGNMLEVLKQSYKYLISGLIMTIMVKVSYRWLNGGNGLITQLILGATIYGVGLMLLKDSLVIENLRQLFGKFKKVAELHKVKCLF